MESPRPRLPGLRRPGLWLYLAVYALIGIGVTALFIVNDAAWLASFVVILGSILAAVWYSRRAQNATESFVHSV